MAKVAAHTVGNAENGADDIELSNEKDAMMELERDPAWSKPSAQQTPPSNVPPARSVIVFGVVLYAACSSTLLVINKVAMHLVPDASFILFCQFAVSVLAVKGVALSQPDMDIEELKWEKVKPFAVATFVFFLCLLSNTQALKSVNVETVIVVRSLSPLAVSVLEHFTLGRALPNLKGWISLVSIGGGAAIYVVTDAGFQIEGYSWLVMYFFFIVLEMVFVKHVISTVQMSTWTRVYYNNMLSLPMAILSAVGIGNMTFLTAEWSFGAVFAVSLSCVVGVAISYAGFNLRQLVSATTFTVVGVMCKLVTVLINDMIWTQHSNGFGHLGLLVCIVAGFAYEKTKT